jgi:hypothetical protein
MLVLLSVFSFNALAGGWKGSFADSFMMILALIYIGIPIIVGAIAAATSKTKKSKHFFWGFIITLGILILLGMSFF